jgi:hypothetical protein
MFNRFNRRREKAFGVGRPRPLDRNTKARIMVRARALAHRTVKGKAYGVLTAKYLAVLEALLWGFHNAASGFCFPSYEAIAEKAHCARSTVGEAIKALEQAGILTWCHRIRRVRVADEITGWRWRVLRTSNAYEFATLNLPELKHNSDNKSSKSENQAENKDQVNKHSYPSARHGKNVFGDSPLERALERLNLARLRKAARA